MPGGGDRKGPGAYQRRESYNRNFGYATMGSKYVNNKSKSPAPGYYNT